MKKVFFVTLIASLVFTAQAGSVLWESSDSAEDCSTNIIAELPQDVVALVSHVVSADSVRDMMGAIYNVTFASLIDGILDANQSAFLRSNGLSGDTYAAAPAPDLAGGEDDDSGAEVPEPSTALLALAGAAALLLRRRRP